MTGFIPFGKFNFSIPFFTLALLLDEKKMEKIRSIFIVKLMYNKIGFFGLIFSCVLIVLLCVVLVDIIYKLMSLGEAYIRIKIFKQDPDTKDYLIEFFTIILSVTFLTIGLGGFLRIIPLKELNLPSIPFGILWCLGFLCYSETLLSLSQERKNINQIMAKRVKNKEIKTFNEVMETIKGVSEK